MKNDYPPEVCELLEWFDDHPEGRRDDVPQRLMDYGWAYVKRDDLHDDLGTMHVTPGVSGFGRNVMRENRLKSEAETKSESEIDKRPAVPVDETKPETDSDDQESRLTINLSRRILILDNVEYEIDSEKPLRWLKVLKDHAGVWISGPNLHQFDKNLFGRADKLRRFLPPEVLELIESRRGPGGGCRISIRSLKRPK